MNKSVVKMNERFRGIKERVVRIDSVSERRFPMISHNEGSRRDSSQESYMYYPNKIGIKPTFKLHPEWNRSLLAKQLHKMYQLNPLI